MNTYTRRRFLQTVSAATRGRGRLAGRRARSRS